MKITIKVRFNSTYPKFEKVSMTSILLYIPEPRTNESGEFIKELLKKKIR